VEGVLQWLEEHAVVEEVKEMQGKEERISFKPAVLVE
jgi:hypothetical protein